MIQSGHGREVLLGNGRSVVRADGSVGIGRVADNKDLDALLGHLIHGPTLNLSNLYDLLRGCL